MLEINEVTTGDEPNLKMLLIDTGVNWKFKINLSWNNESSQDPWAPEFSMLVRIADLYRRNFC